MAQPHYRPRQLSLKQLSKLTIACAAACAIITPTARGIQFGMIDARTVVIINVILVPLGWIALTLLMVKPSPSRTTLLALLGLAPVGTLLGLMVWALLPLIHRILFSGMWNYSPLDLLGFFIGIVVIPLLAVALLVLLDLAFRGFGFMREKSAIRSPRH